jgi:hypothetical protein
MSMVRDFNTPFARIKIGRFSFLLISMFLVVVLRPFLADLFSLSILVEIFFTAILISGVYAFSQKRSVFITVLLLAFLTAVIHWYGHFVPSRSLDILGNVFSLLFTGTLTTLILVYLFNESEVTFDLIVGSICGYFIIGFFWTYLYSILEMFNAGSFLIPAGMGTENTYFTYYSFVTLTTLGYGDMTPLSHPARSLSLLEAVVGQLYVAILIARLVGTHIAQTRK